MPRARFRFDASPSLGSGHAYRCLTLASALVEAGWSVDLVVSAETIAAVRLGEFPVIVVSNDGADEADMIGTAGGQVELLVVDHYGRDVQFESACRIWAKRILVVDDLANRHHDCDFLLDQTLGRGVADYFGLVPPSCRMLLGTDYALLRPQFAANSAESLERRRVSRLKRVFVSMGATDPGNLTLPIIAGLLATNLDLHVDVVLGKAAPHLESVQRFIAESGTEAVRLLVEVSDMAEIMTQADLAIGTGGTTSWERCCMGLPTLMVVVADNQRSIASSLICAGAVLPMQTVTPEAVAAEIERIHRDPAILAKLSNAASHLCDGNGVQRLIQVVTQ